MRFATELLLSVADNDYHGFFLELRVLQPGVNALGIRRSPHCRPSRSAPSETSLLHWPASVSKDGQTWTSWLMWTIYKCSILE